jgi:hypothetical protein
MSDANQPITAAELLRELRDTEQALDSLIDCIVLMPPSFLPDERHDLLAQAAVLRRTTREARRRLAEDT